MRQVLSVFTYQDKEIQLPNVLLESHVKSLGENNLVDNDFTIHNNM